jgi:hypothetical protein
MSSGMNSKYKFNIKQRIYHEQNGLCVWCNKQMDLEVGLSAGLLHPRFATLEHLQDKFSPLGRTNDQTKLAVSCYACNKHRQKLANE